MNILDLIAIILLNVLLFLLQRDISKNTDKINELYDITENERNEELEEIRKLKQEIQELKK